MKKWQRLEHRWDTRQRIEREKTVVQAEAAQTEAQIAEQRRDWEVVGKAYSRRLESPALYTAYEEAYRAYRKKHGHSQASVAFWEIYQRMLDRIPVEAEPFIDYLERDVWEFRSGYTKERVIQFLKSADLSESERVRLCQVALRAVDGEDRREFRRYGGLARVVDAPELRLALRDRLSHPDADIRRRAAWMLYAMGERSPELQVRQR